MGVSVCVFVAVFFSQVGWSVLTSVCVCCRDGERVVALTWWGLSVKRTFTHPSAYSTVAAGEDNCVPGSSTARRLIQHSKHDSSSMQSCPPWK